MMSASHNIAGDFFAPMTPNSIDILIGEYKQQRKKIEQVHEALWDNGLGSVIHNFIEGNGAELNVRHSPNAQKLFDKDGAIKHLNASFWDRALRMTDVLDLMPQNRRVEWHEQIRAMTTPDFTYENVSSTLEAMLSSRERFFAERVDGIFRALSREHVTNRPEGFGKRMILRNVIDCYGLSGTDQGYINDLRCIIAKFMGRIEPSHDATRPIVEAARRSPGEWFDLDGGALKIRCYMKGTGHLEVHPDMAWRLNCILASLYPMAIPSEFREPPKRKAKHIEPIGTPLPFAILSMIAQAQIPGYRIVKNDGPDSYRVGYNRVRVRNTLKIERYGSDKHVREQIDAVMESIGGVWDSVDSLYRFDYDPRSVIDKIVCSGIVPDDKSHQFYPTPEYLAAKMIDLAEIEEWHDCLEPSAGTGALLRYMPEGSTAIEISEVRCEILKQRHASAEVICADFMTYSRNCFPMKFDRVLMNPPFSERRWQDHTERAAELLVPGGKLVAILPEPAQRALGFLDGYEIEWHGPYDNQFARTNVSVVIAVATKPASHP